MTTTTTFNNHAVFIGVDDYSTFDRSTGQKLGTSDLPGSRNDAAIFWRIHRQLGIPAANLRILTSPKIDLSLLPEATPENVGEATEAGILAAAEWLAQALAVPSRPSGFFSYSGHGGWLEGRGLVICPSDVAGPGLEHAIAFTTLHRIFAERRANANLTVLLDCCHAGARSPRADRVRTSLGGLPVPARLAEHVPLIGGRVLAATGPLQSSYQAKFSGVWLGAFSWAVSAIMDQWQSRRHGGGVELELSYGELVERARKLLDALSFEQTPVLRGQPGAAELPVFHAGDRTTADWTLADPNAMRKSGQLDPNCKYQLTFEAIQNEVLSTGTTIGAGYGTTYNPSTEYWSLTASFLDVVRGATAGARLTISQSQNPIDWSSLGFPAEGALPIFGMPSSTIWTRMSSPPPTSAFYSSTSGQYVGVLFDLTAPTTGAPWRGSITWYLGVATTAEYLTSTYAASSSGLTLTKGDPPGLPAEYSWYSSQLTPLTWPTTTIDMQARVLGAGAAFSSSTSNTSLGNKLWLAFTKSSNHDVHVLSSADGVTWSPSLGSPAETHAAAKSAPALAILDTPSGGTLYLAYRDDSSSGTEVHVRWSTNGTSWSDHKNTGCSSVEAPALAALNGKLYMAYTTPGGACMVVQPSDPQSSSSWSSASATTVESGVSGAPAMTVFNGSLYLAFVGSSGAIEIRQSSDGSTWTQAGTLYGGLRNPSITGFNEWLYIACQDASSNVWISSSPGGASWSGYGELSAQVSAVSTNTTPALCPASATSLVLAFADTATSGDNFKTITAT
jgi:hypothetical protein